MARIPNYFERRFRRLLTNLGVADIPAGLHILREAANRLSAHEKIPASLALARVHAALCRKHDKAAKPTHFLCDAGLGGLARWLRAAGYDAAWQPDLDDAGVIRESHRREATLLTTDTLMMERGMLRDEIVPSIWVPPTVEPDEQLTLVFCEMRLSLRPPRCMKCGGELRRVNKEEARPRIPPKTARWRDDFFLCARCDQLFWLGTHWTKIQQTLEKLGRAEPCEVDLNLETADGDGDQASVGFSSPTK
jgi:uncharacterized protein with PIN domain